MGSMGSMRRMGWLSTALLIVLMAGVMSLSPQTIRSRGRAKSTASYISQSSTSGRSPLSTLLVSSPLYATAGQGNFQNFADEEVECVSEGGVLTPEKLLQIAQSGSPYLNVPSSSATKGDSDALAVTTSSSSSFVSSVLTALQTSASLVARWGLEPPSAVSLVEICDAIDNRRQAKDVLNEKLLSTRRYFMLAELLRQNRPDYIEIASFLANRIPRSELPNLQRVTIASDTASTTTSATIKNVVQIDGEPVVDDCALPDLQYQESPLDKLLLGIFRKLVQQEIGYKSSKEGIKGLLEEGRHFKLSEKGEINDSVNQHIFVKKVLGGLLTPFLPPFYRIFMSGIIPSKKAGDPDWLVDITGKLIDSVPDSIPFKKHLVPGKQFGPWFYAPFLTSAVTPPFLAFLLGPCRLNLRKDGNLGGMVVEKCKFLQVSTVHISHFISASVCLYCRYNKSSMPFRNRIAKGCAYINARFRLRNIFWTPLACI